MTLPNASPDSAAPAALPAPSARFLVLYATPTDPQAFERHYRQVHIPLTRRLPGLRRYSLGRNVTTVRGGATCYLIAQLEWDSRQALRAAFDSPEGRATADDMLHLTALSGVQSFVYDTNNLV